MTRWKLACTTLLLCAWATVSLPAQTFTTLVYFDKTHGANPGLGSLVQGVDGNFYGTTFYGGDETCNDGQSLGCGTIFRMTPEGVLNTVHTFSTADGAYPQGGLVLGSDGNFYGTTVAGGANGEGTVFRLSPGGELTTLYSFVFGADGFEPLGPVTEGLDGSFYGTTVYGGTGNCYLGCGTVFKVTPDGVETVLHNFEGTPDGTNPSAGLLLSTDGNFYGATGGGGGLGIGIFFDITPGGVLTKLRNVDRNGSNASGLIQAVDGKFYGTFAFDGHNNHGTVFKMTKTGELTTLHYFDGADGAYARAGVIQATDGNFYGTTRYGGANNAGTVFKIKSDGTFTTLHSLAEGEGTQSFGGLVQGTNGIFYGTTYAGGPVRSGTVFHGSFGAGTIFSLDVGLGPFIAFVRGFAKAGQPMGVLGQGFTGTTGVSFNGIPATFTVESDTILNATVPAGATTGYVTVTTPGGVLTSNVPFRVIP